jgi:hypothetical protein
MQVPEQGNVGDVSLTRRGMVIDGLQVRLGSRTSADCSTVAVADTLSIGQ